MFKDNNLKIKLEQFAILLFLICIPIMVYLSSATESETKLHGVVIDFGATTDDTGIDSFLLVKLEDNRTVKINYDPASKKNVGKKVLVYVRTTKLFGITKYTIVGWN